jgi:pimeloyl-ACP methyl ester carboxylesterase
VLTILAVPVTWQAVPRAAVAAPGALGDFYGQQVTWSTCQSAANPALQCASVVVPLNYRRPHAERISVAISRLAAKDPERRRGVLLLNPGGPGGSGLDLPVQLASRPIAQVYDLIGFDPRGVGRSTPLTCERPSLGTVTSRPDDTEFAVWVANAKAQEAACQRTAGGMRAYVNTPNTARDMDVIRGVLKESRIDYLGFSYGTYLGAVYGSLFPRRLERTVLDSAVGPHWIWREQGRQQAIATRRNVDAWAAWAGQRNQTYGIGRSADDVLDTVEALADRLAADPMVVDGITFDRTTYDVLLGSRARDRPRWDALGQLVKTIRQLTAGQLTPDSPRALDAAKAATVPDDTASEPTDGVYQAVTCEADWPTDLRTYFADMRLFRDRFPYGFGVLRAAPTNCTFRTFTPPERLPELHRSYPVGLVVQGEGDTQTPYDGGLAMAVKLNNRLVSVSDDGTHAQYLHNPCVQATVDRYLIEGVLPEAGASCPGTPRPDVPPDAVTGL